MSGFIAVHCGAGYHKATLRKEYNKICKAACKAGAGVLKSGGSALMACQAAVMILEDCPLTNAGYGSSLTISGDVECDASIMNGEDLNYGACGSVKSVKYPISLAAQICMDQRYPKLLQQIPPSLLVGEGATKYAKQRHLIIVDNEKLISLKAKKSYKKTKRLLDASQKFMDPYKVQYLNTETTEKVDRNVYYASNQSTEKVPNIFDILDTVGAVCVDERGHVASACSSGGISMKYDGRIGQAATYASGVWADSKDNNVENSVAVTTTGAGEYLVKTLLAKELATKIKNADCPTQAFINCMKNDFLGSRYLENINFRIGGALALFLTPSGQGELLWGHTSRTMGIAYMNVGEETCNGQFSELPREKEGLSTTVSGVKFNLDLKKDINAEITPNVIVQFNGT